MTKKPPPKRVPAGHATGRLGNARAFLADARALLEAKGPAENANPVLSLITLAAVAYTDALTAKLIGAVNQKDHLASMKLLKDALGNRLEGGHEKRLRRLLDEKHSAEYGARVGRMDDARRAFEDLEAYARWVESELTAN